MNLSIVKTARFGGLNVDYYGDLRGEFYMTRDQIGRALEYNNPMIAIAKIHSRYSQRLDPLSLTKLVNGREVFFYSSKGVYEIIRHSSQPKADIFYDFVYEIIEGLRKGYFKLQAEKQTQVWQDTRSLSKEIRRKETDQIKQLVEYAAAQGSRNASRYYTSISRLADKAAGITFRNEATVGQLAALILVEQMIAQEIAQGIAGGIDYHQIYGNCQTRLGKAQALIGKGGLSWSESR